MPGHNVDATDEFITEMPRRMVRLVPKLAHVKVLRQWAGSYEMSPDGNPLCGETPVRGLYVSTGARRVLPLPQLRQGRSNEVTGGCESVRGPVILSPTKDLSEIQHQDKESWKAALSANLQSRIYNLQCRRDWQGRRRPRVDQLGSCP